MRKGNDRKHLKITEGRTHFIFNKDDYPFDLNVVQARMLERLSDKDFTFHPSDKVLKRFRLWWVQLGHCFWCNQKMTFGIYPDGRIPETECTIDHLDSRNTRRRGTYNRRDMQRTVGACSKCNNDRAAEETTKVAQNGGNKL